MAYKLQFGRGGAERQKYYHMTTGGGGLEHSRYVHPKSEVLSSVIRGISCKLEAALLVACDPHVKPNL